MGLPLKPGRLDQVLSANIRLEKHSSLFCLGVSDEDKKGFIS
jgi:hypothetical protein